VASGSGSDGIDVRSLKAFKAIERLEKLGKLEARIVVKGDAYPNGTPVADVAQWMEYGTAKIPPRPFMAQARLRVQEVLDVLHKEQTSIVNGNRRPETAMRRVAQKMATLAHQSIDDAPTWAAPLAESTVAKKGHDRPLYETGRLRDSVYWQVVDNGKVKEEGKAGGDK
jgi:hypothetical protein